MPVAAPTETAMIRVIVIEDQRELREGLKTLLDFSPNFRCVRSFGSMEDALENIEADAADLILTDIGLPRLNGIEGTRILREKFPALPIIQFSIDGTIGQSLAGADSSGGVFGLRGGFWSTQLAPTAAGASISGRIRDAAGKGIRNVQLTLIGAATGEIFYARSGGFGFYRFENLPTGQNYILTVSARRFTFNPNTRFISLVEDLTQVDFVAEPSQF